MTPKTVATLLILSAFATAGANSASAQDSASPQGAVRGDGFQGGGGGSFQGGNFPGGGLNRQGFPDKAPMDTGSGAATGMATTMDMATGTESLPVTMSALSSASV